MADIQTELKRIQEAVYGREVRSSIHDSIEQCYSDVSAAKTLADSATANATTAATNANDAAAKANDIATTLQTKLDNGDFKGEKGDPGESNISFSDLTDEQKESLKGKDGVSPTVTTSKTGSTATITITDVNGEHSFTLTDAGVELPMSVENGGTGATAASAALVNLGALPTAGGTMTGDISFASDKGARWTTTNGTQIHVHSGSGNELQVALKPSGVGEFTAVAVATDGSSILSNSLTIGAATPAVKLVPNDQSAILNAQFAATSDGAGILQTTRPDGGYRNIVNNAAADDLSYGVVFSGTVDGTYFANRVFHEGWTIPLKNLPFKVAYGTAAASPSTGKEATLDYSAAGFTAVPVVVATYSTDATSSPSVSGYIKVYAKTTASALLTLTAGDSSSTRAVDWIAIGV